MKIDILASGSSGNCIAIRSPKTTILVDAGIAKTKIEKRLLEVGIRPDEIQAIFITHAHSDHVKGLPLANKYHIPVYAAEEEWKDIEGVESSISYYIDRNETVPWGDIEITSFPVHHDSYDPRGYVIQTDKGKLSICLDTGHVDDEMLNIMKDSKVYIIEANHEVNKLLTHQGYPDFTKKRILSDNGHLSNEQTAEVLYKLVKGDKEMIYLVHLSSRTNEVDLAKLAVINKLKTKGLQYRKNYMVEVV